MPLPRTPVLACVLALVISAFAPALPVAQQVTHAAPLPHDGVVAIVNTENATRQLSIGDLRRILLGEITRWPNGANITIAMRPIGQPERAAVLRLICGMSDADFARYLLQAAYRGDAQNGIKLLDTPNGVKRFVFNVPGAIGFVRRDEVDSSIKLVTLTGTVPKESAFGLTLLPQ